VRSATSSKPRNSCATPKPRTACAFQSESSGKFRSSACIQAMCGSSLVGLDGAADRLNHLARWYLDELRRRMILPPMPKPSPTALNDYDDEQLAAGLKRIGETNRAISAHLDGS
jgi:hypothetical protein